LPASFVGGASLYRAGRWSPKSETVGGLSYVAPMEATETTRPLSVEDYWARMQALREELRTLRPGGSGPGG